MIEGLLPYAEYKESGLPWLGRCPKHWSVRRTKILFHERVQKGFPNEPLLAATQTKGVVKKEDYETRTVTAQKDLHLLKLVEVGDYVISLRSFQGGIEVAHCRGIISPAYTVLKPRKSATSGYFSHFFKAKPFIDSLSLFVTGIREGQNIDYDRLSRAEMPLPPDDEQAAIVRFLGHANRKIDGFIGAKRKLIALLGEQKEAIIHRAVTCGLNPNAPLKPSGMPWLDWVPSHWPMHPNRSLFQIRKRIVGSRHCELQVLSLTKRGVIVRDMDAGGKFSSFWERSQEVRPGDMVFCFFDVDETPRGVGLSRVQGMISPDYTVMQCPSEPIATFLELFYIAMDNHKMLKPLYTGLRKRISKPLFLAAKTPIPPDEELRAIVEYVKSETEDLDQSSAVAHKEISLMQEYRTRLTADVVTGKLDVRAAAAKLPLLPDDSILDATEPEEEL